MKSFREQVVTTDYIVDETLTLLRKRGENQRAVAFGKRVIDSEWVKLIAITNDDFAEAWQLFQNFHDKAWSFTDCTSRVVIERLNIQRAFAFDDHFHQFGNVTVVP